jgi:hypothetical protein
MTKRWSAGLAGLVFFFGVSSITAEEWLQQGDARILGHKVSDDKFTTCNKVDIDLKKLGEHEIKPATEQCKGPGRIDGLERRKELDLYKKMMERA